MHVKEHTRRRERLAFWAMYMRLCAAEQWSCDYTYNGQ